MPFLAAEASPKEGEGALEGELRADDPASQDEDVQVVVLDPLAGRVGVVADGGSDPAHLARRHGRPDAAPADEDRPLGAAERKSPC